MSTIINRDKNNRNTKSEERICFGCYENVFLTQREYDKLKNSYPAVLDNFIEQLLTYKKSSGKKYADDGATLVAWINRNNSSVKTERKYDCAEMEKEKGKHPCMCICRREEHERREKERKAREHADIIDKLKKDAFSGKRMYDWKFENSHADIKHIYLDVLGYVPELMNNPKAMEMVGEIIAEGAVTEEVDRAKGLLDKLSEYKPLVKVEEVEEQNYNMIDNVLNNGAEKARKEEDRKEMDKPRGMVSLKERLAEKKAIIAGNDKSADTQENVKKIQREM